MVNASAIESVGLEGEEAEGEVQRPREYGCRGWKIEVGESRAKNWLSGSVSVVQGVGGRQGVGRGSGREGVWACRKMIYTRTRLILPFFSVCVCVCPSHHYLPLREAILTPASLKTITQTYSNMFGIFCLRTCVCVCMCLCVCVSLCFILILNVNPTFKIL